MSTVSDMQYSIGFSYETVDVPEPLKNIMRDNSRALDALLTMKSRGSRSLERTGD
jgi:hypothetical protein